jgi:hypothetical protein
MKKIKKKAREGSMWALLLLLFPADVLENVLRAEIP